MQIGKRWRFLPALALGLLALPATAQAQSPRRDGPWDRGPIARPEANAPAGAEYDADDWFDRSAVVAPYDSYWFEPGFRGRPGSYTAWEWNRDRNDWMPVAGGDRVQWFDSGARWYPDPEDAGARPPEFDAAREFVWNPTTGRWERDQGASTESDDLFTTAYVAATTPQERARRTPADEDRSGAQTIRVNGTIRGFREVDLLGRSEPHLLAKLRLEDRDQVVDLGPKDDLGGLDLSSGRRITVHGRRGSIDGRDVILALRISANGEVVEVTRNPAPRERPDAVGRLRDWRSIDLANRRGRHTYLRLSRDGGSDLVVDAGPGASPSDLGLDRGDRIAVRGRRTSVNGRSILVAHTIEAESVADERDEGAAGGAGDRISRQPWKTDVSWDDLAVGNGRYRFDGYIEDWRQVDTAEGSRSSLAKMCLEDGSCMIVDLGADVSLSDLRLQRWSWITITGTRSSVNANPVLRAERIQVSGRTVEPDRERSGGGPFYDDD